MISVVLIKRHLHKFKKPDIVVIANQVDNIARKAIVSFVG